MSPQYSIGTVARLTGLSPERIRAWEARYKAITPKRSATGRRTYTDEQLSRLKLLVEITKYGHAISAVARLPDDQLSEAIDASRSKHPNIEKLQIVARVIKGLSKMEIDECDARLATAFVNLDPWQLATEVIAPLVEEVERSSAGNNLRSSHKHLIFSLLRARLYATMQPIQPSKQNPKIRFATLAGTGPDIEALTACFLARTSGLAASFMGPEMAASDIVDVVTTLDTAAVCVSVSAPTPDEQVIDALLELQTNLPSSVDCWIFGTGSAEVRSSIGPDHCECIESYITLRDKFSAFALLDT